MNALKRIQNGAPILAWLVLATSAALLLVTALAYVFRPVAFSAFTVFPTWCWAVGGVLLCSLTWTFRPTERSRCARAAALLVVSWIIAWLALSEEPTSLLRTLWTADLSTQPDSQTGRLRIVTLNCGGGSADAAREVLPWNPDIVLLQEIPEPLVLQEIASKLFGERGVVVAELDTAIIARGPMTADTQQGGNRRTLASATTSLPGIGIVRLASIHLTVPPIDISLWRPSTWRSHSSSRRQQREQLMRAIGHWIELDQSPPTILAGDFNAPQGDWLLKPLRPLLRDAFNEAGIGWGNTIENSIPVLRIDQIWLSDHFKAVAVAAFKTSHSDHRLVVADVEVAAPSASPAPLP